MMYQRFKRGLVKPSELALYLRDSSTWIVAYLFLLLVIMMLPFFVAEYSYSGMTSREYRILDESIPTLISDNYKIENGKLIIPLEVRERDLFVTAGAYTIAINNAPTDIESTLSRFTFVDEGIRYSIFGREIGYFTYESVGLENYNFNDYSSINKQLLLNALNSILLNHQFENKFSQTVFQALILIFEYLFVVTMVALLFRSDIPYRFRFKMTVYASTIYVIFSVLAQSFMVEFLMLVGFVLLLFYTFRAMSFILVKKVNDE